MEIKRKFGKCFIPKGPKKYNKQKLMHEESREQKKKINTTCIKKQKTNSGR